MSAKTSGPAGKKKETTSTTIPAKKSNGEETKKSTATATKSTATSATVAPTVTKKRELEGSSSTEEKTIAAVPPAAAADSASASASASSGVESSAPKRQKVAAAPSPAGGEKKAAVSQPPQVPSPGPSASASSKTKPNNSKARFRTKSPSSSNSDAATGKKKTEAIFLSNMDVSKFDFDLKSIRKDAKESKNETYRGRCLYNGNPLPLIKRHGMLVFKIEKQGQTGAPGEKKKTSVAVVSPPKEQEVLIALDHRIRKDLFEKVKKYWNADVTEGGMGNASELTPNGKYRIFRRPEPVSKADRKKYKDKKIPEGMELLPPISYLHTVEWVKDGVEHIGVKFYKVVKNHYEATPNEDKKSEFQKKFENNNIGIKPVSQRIFKPGNQVRTFSEWEFVINNKEFSFRQIVRKVYQFSAETKNMDDYADDDFNEEDIETLKTAAEQSETIQDEDEEETNTETTTTPSGSASASSASASGSASASAASTTSVNRPDLESHELEDEPAVAEALA